MNMERRGFLAKTLAVGAGALALARGLRTWAKGLPSDPGAAAKAGPDEIVLPPFEKNLAVSLDQALLNRKSSRSYEKAALTREQLSRLLWATTGVNRADGKRTTPSAMATYPVDLLVALPEGVFKFEPKDHKLIKVSGEDVRAQVPIQPNFKNAAMIALYVINKNQLTGGQMQWADLEIGCMGQNLFLEAAAMNLASCIFALIKADKASQTLKLKSTQVLRIAQAVGPGKE